MINVQVINRSQYTNNGYTTTLSPLFDLANLEVFEVVRTFFDDDSKYIRLIGRTFTDDNDDQMYAPLISGHDICPVKKFKSFIRNYEALKDKYTYNLDGLMRWDVNTASNGYAEGFGIIPSYSTATVHHAIDAFNDISYYIERIEDIDEDLPIGLILVPSDLAPIPEGEHFITLADLERATEQLLSTIDNIDLPDNVVLTDDPDHPAYAYTVEDGWVPTNVYTSDDRRPRA